MNRPRNEEMKPIILALGAGAGAAVVAMMVPVSLIEGITGATGLSELIPATGAPLGGTARAIIAFFAGAVTLMMAMGYLMRRSPDMKYNIDNSRREMEIEEPGNSLLSKLQKRISRFKVSDVGMPEMPWTKRTAATAPTSAPSFGSVSGAQTAPKYASWFKKHDDDIFDLSDLPRLRTNDAHPDAPARRPISALNDLAEASLTNRPEQAQAAPLQAPPLQAPPLQAPPLQAKPLPTETPIIAPLPVTPAAYTSEPVLNIAQAATQNIPVTPNMATAPVISAPILIAQVNNALDIHVAKLAKSPLADLVAQLETAINQRMYLLNAIEDLSAQVETPKAAVHAKPQMQNDQVFAPSSISNTAPVLETILPSTVPATPRPPLEAVPASPQIKQDQDMDAALNAALETLQRMNVQGR